MSDKNTQYCFEKLNNINQEEILKNIKTKLSFKSIEPITQQEFDEKVDTFPNTKELFEEYNSQIIEQSQKNIELTNQSGTNEESKNNELIELPNPIKLTSDKDEINEFYKGSVNKENDLEGKGSYITNDYLYYGFFQNNQFNGKGILVNKDGSSLFGDWVNGVCTGKGILKVNNLFEYEGDFVENKKQGNGIEKYPDGSRYEGQFHDNKKNGRGKYIISRGETYEGEFKDDLFDGEGTYKWTLESREYTGQFKNGNMNGKGINKFKDGCIYEGYYKNGLKHGYGKYTWPNGKVFYGNWLNNKLHGNGYYELDNDKYNITFRFGKIISTRKTEDVDESKRIKFRYENIVDKENIEEGEKYICPICNTLLYQPQKCLGCLSNFCIDCIKDGKDNKKCIKCGGIEYEMNLNLLHELCSKINVNCDACQTSMDYKSAISHYHS